MSAAVVLFTRDLRVHDHPALAAAARYAETVVPLFVVDAALGGRPCPNRTAFLAEALEDLDASLRARGGALVVRAGETVAETMRLVAETRATHVLCSADVSAVAQRREARLTEACRVARVEFEAHPGVTVVPPGVVEPSGGGDHYKVFTPYYRAWAEVPWRAPAPVPKRLRLPDEWAPGRPAAVAASGPTSPGRDRGGETEARTRWRAWLRRGMAEYDAGHDRLAAAGTSRLSPYLRWGCLSPLEVATGARRTGSAGFLRQVAWRDFHHQVADAFPALSRRDYRPRDRRWKGDGPEFDAWREARTGVPLVDAAMRQLEGEGWVHNRARMVAASFLTKTLGVHWKLGADHYMRWLTDGEVWA